MRLRLDLHLYAPPASSLKHGNDLSNQPTLMTFSHSEQMQSSRVVLALHHYSPFNVSIDQCRFHVNSLELFVSDKWINTASYMVRGWEGGGGQQVTIFIFEAQGQDFVKVSSTQQ